MDWAAPAYRPYTPTQGARPTFAPIGGVAWPSRGPRLGRGTSARAGGRAPRACPSIMMVVKLALPPSSSTAVRHGLAISGMRRSDGPYGTHADRSGTFVTMALVGAAKPEAFGVMPLVPTRLRGEVMPSPTNTHPKVLLPLHFSP